MARMRKIPARKHHGVRDPLKQLEQREKKLKNVTNHPPEKGNDQKVSFRFAQFKKLADATKAGKKIKRMHSGKEDKPTASTKKHKAAADSSTNARPIKQFIDEADEDYLRRVNRITNESLREAKYEAKYGVSVVRDGKTGMITIKKKPHNEIDELLKHKQKIGKMGKRGGKAAPLPAKPMDPKVAKALIKQAIKEGNEEQKRQVAPEVEEYKRDTFKFGEVVNGPPALLTLPRKATKSETVPRPGKKGNLLLKSLLNQAAAATATTAASGAAASIDDDEESTQTKSKKKKKPAAKPSKVQMKGKRKQLPTATRNMLETEQNKMIELYRKLKKSREQAQKTS